MNEREKGGGGGLKGDNNKQQQQHSRLFMNDGIFQTRSRS